MSGAILEQRFDFFGNVLSLREIGEAVGASPVSIYALAKRLDIAITDAAVRPDVAQVCDKWVADAFGVHYQTYVSRRKRGLSPEDAVVAPVGNMGGLDLAGRTFGKLTVLRQGPLRKTHRTWECHCACGSTAVFPSQRLIDGRTLSCGCDRPKRKKWPEARVGMTFGRLTIQEIRATVDGKYATCRCVCSCGNEIDVSEGRIRSGGTASCGCLRRETTSRLGKGHAKVVEFFGEKLTLDELSRVVGVHKETISFRMKRGMSVEQAAQR